MPRSACRLKVTDKNSWGVPNIALSNNLTSPGNPTSSPFAINDKVFQGVDNFSWVIGKHSLRMGGEYRYNQFPQVGNEFPRGQFFFTGAFTSNANTQSGGYSGADWLLGAHAARRYGRRSGFRRFPQSRMGGLFRRHLESYAAPDHHCRSPLGGRAADVGRVRPRSGHPAQRVASLDRERVRPEQTSRLSARGHRGIFTMASTSVTFPRVALPRRRFRLLGMAGWAPG